MSVEEAGRAPEFRGRGSRLAAGGSASAATVTTTAIEDIAAAREVAEVYRLGSSALAELLAPARCLVFDRDEYGEVRLAHRWQVPGRREANTGSLAILNTAQGWWMTAIQTGERPRACHPEPLPGQLRTFTIPLVATETLYGLVVPQECRHALSPTLRREVIAVAATMALALQGLLLRARLAAVVLPEQLDEAIMQERRRIAREIHDGAAQSLAYLNLKTELLDRLLARDPVAAREQVAVVRQALQGAMKDLRRCIGDLRRPTAGQGPAMTAQLRSLASTLTELPNLELALQQVSGVRLAPEVERTVIGIVREALHNIRKHADASSVRVEVEREADALRLLVADDGKGFQPGELSTEAVDHFGMAQMRELAQELGGQLAVDSRPGAGTRLEARIPLPATPASG